MNDVFNREIPELLQAHREHLLASAIGPDVIKERKYASVLGKAQLKELGFSSYQQRPPGLLIPLWGVEGKVVGHQFRPDRPRERDGKPVKYETPHGAANHLDCPPRCRKDLGNPGIPLWITEGVKKADSLASCGACALALAGVWSWRGRNEYGGLTVLSDWDLVALNGRTVYLAFDSDIVSKPPVRQALLRLSDHLERKDAAIRVVVLPQEGDGKTGIDDFLARGHSLDEAVGLAIPLAQFKAEEPVPELDRGRDTYAEKDGCLCWAKRGQHGAVLVPLCNFTGRAVEEVVRDNGVEETRSFLLEGRLHTGKELPRIDVPAGSFSALGWITEKWGMEAIVTAGTSAKDRLREAIQLRSQSLGVGRRLIFTHTGWRTIRDRPVFLTASGALGTDGVEVELEDGMDRYRLPQGIDNVSEAMERSLDFLTVAPLPVTLPLWGAMYLAPLCPFITPAFTLWLIGPTGSLKSTLAALALSHFGSFTEKTLPAAWKDTANYLEKRLFMAKDVPLVIDDFLPSGGKDMEPKAEIVDRAQGNRAGRGRLRSDTSSRARYTPRGVAISTGEDIPWGQSHLARTFIVEVERAMINLRSLSQAQKEASSYPLAMAAYILWLAQNWETLAKDIPRDWESLRQAARGQCSHLRIPEAVASLYLGASVAFRFAQHLGVLNPEMADKWRAGAWEELLKLGEAQSRRVEEEKPSRRFLDILSSLLDQGKVCLQPRGVLDGEGKAPAPAQEQLGWKDEQYAYLIPGATYNRVARFCRDEGNSFPVKERTLWKDLDREKIIVHTNGRLQVSEWIDGRSRWVLKVPWERLLPAGTEKKKTETEMKTGVSNSRHIETREAS